MIYTGLDICTYLKAHAIFEGIFHFTEKFTLGYFHKIAD